MMILGLGLVTGMLLGIVALALILLFFVIGQYNGLVTLRNRFRNAFAQIEVQLKRRHDLIPNLVETAKAYMSHEKDTLEAVIQARNSALSARESASTEDVESLKNLMVAEQGLGSALGGLFALSESYPDLKANQNMMQLNEELTSTENKVSFARQSYNDAVTSYNTKRETFPSNLIAGAFNFTPATLFEVSEPTEREPVKVSFD